jgi:hypothetical protein
MSDEGHPIEWKLTTWEGNRRAQLRRSLSLSLRERLEALDDMADLDAALSRARADGKLRSSTAAISATENAAGTTPTDDES